jgi:hypothetical protein
MQAMTHTTISSGKDFRETIRAGAYAWPGGYPLYFITQDGAAICFDCAKKNARQIFADIRAKYNTGWQVVALDINYEDADLDCDNCNKHIESAYCD